ncbi:sclerostin-like [Amphiura filiformis]|uniref:sclerostin-like n=1 Tax=Amphiura filiformis TaxID=82378 RepID=UPI003B226EB3
MRPNQWRRIWLVAVVYMWVVCLLCNGLRVEDTKAPETAAVPTIPEGNTETTTNRKQKDRQRDRDNSNQLTTIENTHLDGSGVYNPDDLQMGCTELRSKRYISDGFCTSIKPITEVVCAGECLPVDNGQLPFYAQYVKVWSREKTREYRCVNDVVRQKRVHLICDNNERRTYRIRTVRSCKCKKYNREHNRSQLHDNASNNNGNTQQTRRKTKSAENDSRKSKRRRKNSDRRGDPRTQAERRK